MADEIRDSWGRFLCHWVAATFGFFLRGLLPVLKSWADASHLVTYPRWWAALLYGAMICLASGAINSNLPPSHVSC